MGQPQHRKWMIFLGIGLLILTTFVPTPRLQAQDQPSVLIESDDLRVLQAGTWAKQSASAASGEQYLYNTGGEADLSLAFAGTTLEILYVSGPNMGTLAIEVDGTVLRTLITTSDQTAYQQRTVINYLTDEAHTVRVYAVQGVVGIDAFGVPNVETATPAATPQKLDVTDLLEAAQTDGTVRVIVGFNAPFIPEGKLASGADVQSQRAAIGQGRAAVVNQLTGTQAVVNAKSNAWTIPYLAAEVDTSALQVLATLPAVISIEPDRLSDPVLASSTAVIDADLAWALGYEGTGQTVAILDTGTQVNHSFFGGRVVQEACWSSSGGSDESLCGDGTDEQIGPGAAAPSGSHGTHVAGIAAGNGSSYDGVARNANIIAIQVFTLMTCNGSPCIRTYDSDWISGLNYVYSLRTTYTIAAANLSIGGGNYVNHCDFGSAKTMMDQLLGANIATVVAAGNDGFANAVSYPGCVSTAITVGASTDGDAAAGFSNMDDQVDVFAPGTAIDSSVVGGGFGSMQGTSMATPHVTGAYALIRSAVPTASVNQILAALQATGTPITENGVTRPRIDLDNAIAILQSPPAAPSAPSNAALTTPTQTGLTLTWQDNSNNEVGFRVYRWNGTAYVTVANVLGGTSYALTGLTCSTAHQYAVAAYNVGGESAQAVATGSTALCAMTNDTFATARYLASPPTTYTQDVMGSTATGTDPALCVATVSNTVWYRFSVYNAARVTLSTAGSQYNTVMAVFVGAENALTRLACNDDFSGTTSQLTFDAFRFTNYYVMVANVGSTPVAAPTGLTIASTGTSLVGTSDALAIFSASGPTTALTYNLTDPLPATGSHTSYALGGQTGAQWVVGDWNGDGQKTPGYTRNGAFYFTDSLAPGATYTAVWIGPSGIPVAGRFSATMQNECIGVMEQGTLAPYTVFVLWYTCELGRGSGGQEPGTGQPIAPQILMPTIHYHWVSAVLPDQGGFTGAHQFAVGDWNNDGLDTVAARRGPFIAYSNEAITTTAATFPTAQYFGVPHANDYGYLVAGDWDNNDVDTFGLYYQNGYFYRRNDLAWNSGLYTLQRLGQLLGAGPVTAVSWRVE